MLLTFIGQKDLITHDFYEESIKNYEGLKVHATREYPYTLLDLARPNEEQKYKDYRSAVYKSPTKGYYDKVINVLSGGQSAQDWSINFPKQSTRTGESLFDYTTKNYPFFDSLENWFFSFGIYQMIEDSNGVIAVYANPTESDNEYYRPFTNIFKSKQVIQFAENEYAELLSSEKSIVIDRQKEVKEGHVFYCFDRNTVSKWIQTGKLQDYQYIEEWSINHNIGYLPVFKLGGFIEKFKNNEILYKSFIDGILDAWDEAVRRYSDHQVNMVLHLHPREWEIADSECPTCRGKGTAPVKTMQGNTIEVTCSSCDGGGRISTNTPFGKKIIKPATREGAGINLAIPTPPAGIIGRDIDSIDFLKKEYKDKIKEGLSAVNMEFVMDEPDENSGIAKLVDRGELYKYIGTVYRHIIENVLKPSYYFVAAWRYGVSGIENILPVINIPQKFDLLTAKELGEQLKTAKDAKFNPAIVNKLEVDYSRKEFGEDSNEAKIMNLISQVDPMPGLNQEDKMVILSNGGVTRKDYIISSKLLPFINKAIRENEGFLDLRILDQIRILEKYASEVEIPEEIKENEPELTANT